MKQIENLTKRDFMAQEMFLSLYKTFRVRRLYGDKSINAAVEAALTDAYGIADAILAFMEEK